MVDVTQKPFFGYNEIIDALLEPIRSSVDLRLQGFTRTFPDRTRIPICYDYKWAVDYYTILTLYRYGLFEGDPTKLVSGYNMWDHLPYAPPEIYHFAVQKWGIGHGLTVVKQYGNYVDLFVFATDPKNHQINNFYLNYKDKIEAFIAQFYSVVNSIIPGLMKHAIIVPPSLLEVHGPLFGLTQRQRECGQLLMEGLKTKEIARALSLSPRTVEDHINALKGRVNAKNRPELVRILGKIL